MYSKREMTRPPVRRTRLARFAVGTLVPLAGALIICAAPAAATEGPYWAESGMHLTSKLAMTFDGNIEMSVGREGGERDIVRCSDEGSGRVGISAGDEITKMTVTNCSASANFGECYSNTPAIEAKNLPWPATLNTVGETIRNKFEEEGEKRPDFVIKCKGSVWDECPKLPEEVMSNDSGDVQGTIEGAEENCVSLKVRFYDKQLYRSGVKDLQVK